MLQYVFRSKDKNNSHGDVKTFELFFVIVTEDRSGRVLSKHRSKFYNRLPHSPLVDIKVKQFYITTSRKRSASGLSELSIQEIFGMSTGGKPVDTSKRPQASQY